MNGKVWVGIILILLGSLLLLEHTGVWDFSEVFHEYWPVLLVLAGVWLLVRRSRERPDRPVAAPPGGGETSELLQESNTFGDIVLRIASKQFQGGSVSGVFGDIRLDASEAELVEGEQTLTVNGVFGDVRITLPRGIPAAVNSSTVFGHVEVFDTRQGGVSPALILESPGYAAATRKLRVRVSQVFGDVEVRQ